MTCSAIIVQDVTLQTKFHSSANFREILGICQSRPHTFRWPRKVRDRIRGEKLSGVLRECLGNYVP